MAIVLILLAALALGIILQRSNPNPSNQITSDDEPLDWIFADISGSSDSHFDHSHGHHSAGAEFCNHDASSSSFDSGHGGGFDCGGGHH